MSVRRIGASRIAGIRLWDVEGGIGSRGTGHPHGFIRAGVTSGGIGGRVWRACLVTAPAIIRAAIACTVIVCTIIARTGGVIRSAIRGLGLSHHNGRLPALCLRRYGLLLAIVKQNDRKRDYRNRGPGSNQNVGQ